MNNLFARLAKPKEQVNRETDSSESEALPYDQIER